MNVKGCFSRKPKQNTSLPISYAYVIEFGWELPCTKFDFCQHFVYILAAFWCGEKLRSRTGLHQAEERIGGRKSMTAPVIQGAKLIKVILLQSGLVAVVAAVAAGLVGARGAISALVGGFAYILPNLLFVLRMALAPERTSVLTFFAGEFFKIAGTIGILVVAVRYYEVHWLCMLVGLLAALKANLFAFLLKT